MNAAGIVIVERELTELDLSNPFATLSTIAQNLEDLVTEYNLDLTRILGASIMLGISDGSVVIKGNEVTSTMLEWKNVPVVDYLQSKLKFRFCTVSRARALLQVEIEKLSSPSPEQKYLLISCGLGIGAAFHIVGRFP